MMKGTKRAPAEVVKGCGNCLFRIGGEMCPDERRKQRDNSVYIEEGACENYRYRGKFSIKEMKKIIDKNGPRQVRDKRDVNSRLDGLRRKARGKS